jgi:hypothetical protein
VLFVGAAADALGDDAAFDWRLPIAVPLTPVAFLHWSSDSSWAVALNLISAHCGCVSRRTWSEKRLTYVIQRTPTLPQLHDLNTRLQSIQPLIAYARVPRSLETRVQVEFARVLFTR